MIEFILVNITFTTFLALAFHSHLSLFPFMYSCMFRSMWSISWGMKKCCNIAVIISLESIATSPSPFPYTLLKYEIRSSLRPLGSYHRRRVLMASAETKIELAQFLLRSYAQVKQVASCLKTPHPDELKLLLRWNVCSMLRFYAQARSSAL